MITRVELKNWKSHHENSLEFGEGVNGLIGTMGSGKSSVLEAVVFGLFGTTPKHNSREVKLDDLIRRTPSEAEKAEIQVEFMVDNEDYSVKRDIERGKGTTRSELRKNGELIEAPSTRDVTKQVEKLLGLDFKSFTRAIYSEQNRLDLFLNMRPGDRKERIDQLLKLDRFETARKNIVKVENNLENDKKLGEKELKNLEDQLDKEEFEKLDKKTLEKKEELQELETEVEELDEKFEQKKEELDKLKDLEESFEKLEKRETKLNTRKESIQNRTKEIKKILKDFEDPKKELKSKKKTKVVLEELKADIEDLEREKQFKEKKLEDLEDSIEELGEEAERFERFEEIDKELEKKKKAAEKIKQKGNRLYAERKELEKSVGTLKGSEKDCPVCGQDMDKKHRKEVMRSHHKKAEKLKKKENKLRKKLEASKKSVSKLEKKRDKLLEYRSSKEKLEEKKEELKKQGEEKEELEDDLEEKRKYFSEDRLEEVKKDVRKLERAEELEELEEKLEHLDEKLSETREELEGIDFESEELENLREKVSKVKESRSVKKKELENGKELLKEQKKRLDQMENQFKKLDDIQRDIEKLDSLLDFVHDYRNGLEKTQVSLRELFVKQLNGLMDGIWKQLYPYDDYYSIRLNAEQEYRLQVLDSENNWVNAEAEVSGGERHSAALVMRLALTFTLSPKLQVIMLDEPTHNMDSSAVEELAETLRQRSSDLIEQMFIVTHDPALESSVTGNLYRLDKKNTETGLTEVREVK